MGNQRKALIRANFRDAVFGRDNYRCRLCGGTSDLDAHHIISRDIMPNGGYVKENGISVCEYCHIECEKHYEYPISINKAMVYSHYHVSELFKIIGSSEELARKCSERLNDV